MASWIAKILSFGRSWSRIISIYKNVKKFNYDNLQKGFKYWQMLFTCFQLPSSMSCVDLVEYEWTCKCSIRINYCHVSASNTSRENNLLSGNNMDNEQIKHAEVLLSIYRKDCLEFKSVGEITYIAFTKLFPNPMRNRKWINRFLGWFQCIIVW